VEIRQGDRVLRADLVRVNEAAKIAWLQGNVVMVLEEDIFTGKEGQFNLATRCGEMVGARLFVKRNHFHVDSPLMRKTGENTYYAEQSTVTTCDADRPVWSFYARSLWLTLEGYASGKGGQLRLAGIPVMYLPYSVLPVKTTRQTGFLVPTFGQQKLGGTALELPFYWAISDHADSTFYQTYITRRGYMQGGEARFQGHQGVAGNFRVFYIRDGSPQTVTPHRYWVAGMLNHPLGDWDMRLTMDRVSDQGYLKDFNFGYMGLNRYSRTLLLEMGRDLEEEEVNNRVSTALVSRNFNWANLTAYSRYYERVVLTDPRPFQRTPGLSLISLPLPLGNWPLWVGLNSSYNYFVQDQGMTGDRLEVHPQMWLQGQVLPGIYFSSRVGFRETLFRIDHTAPTQVDSNSPVIEPPERYLSRALYDSKVTVGGAWSRDYGRDGGASRFYRHVFRPEITYWNIPRYTATRYPPFDPFDLGWVVQANRNLPIRDGDDPIGGVNALTMSLTNNLLGRDTTKQGLATVRDLLWLRLSHSVFFTSSSMGMDGTDVPHNRFSDILAEAEFRPFRRLIVGSNLGVTPGREGFSRSNIKFTFLGLPRMSYVGIDYLFIKNFAQQINFNSFIDLLPSVKTWVQYSHTFRTDNRLERRYGLILQRQCWGVNLSYTQRPDDQRFGATVFIPGVGEKLKRSPVRFQDELMGKEGPDFL
jgi:LPS-assembly protein